MTSKLKFGVAVAASLLASVAAIAQTYPTNNPSYTPAAIQALQTLTAPGNSTPFQTNGVGTLYVRVLGTNAGLVATIQGTEARQQPGGAAPTWTSLPVDVAGGVRQGQIVGNGLYRINVAGLAQVRLNVSALTSGNVLLTMAAGPGDTAVSQISTIRNTYSAVIKNLTLAATPTDIFTLTGAAGVITRVTHADCSANASTAGTIDLVALTRSTANSAGTVAPASPHDPSQPPALAVAQSYTANPTPGTLAGTFRAGKLAVPVAATGAIMQILGWDFGGASRNAVNEILLRSPSQVFALNGNGAALP